MSQDDVIGPWSEEKLEMLRDYLEAYTRVMKGWKSEISRVNYHYVDAFAGAGSSRARDDEERYIAGSPRVALEFFFNSYTFIEMDSSRVQRLQELRSEFPERDIRIYQGDCNDILKNRITPCIRYENYSRGVVFLDPFTLNLEWDTVEAVAQTKALEIFLNFPTMALNRTALPNDPSRLTRETIKRMDRFWGTSEWYGQIYEEAVDLFGDKHVYKPISTTARRLSHLYKSRLEEVFSRVTDPITMLNSKGIPIYCLIFAGHNPTGARIAGHILKKPGVYKQLG
ncbi:MAG: three-Cys-motif partner protein TcmP [Anaerolineae bacterium]|nr:three-Cys-motif partner protein TcmP [Anaerolineae bacterium]